MAKKLISYDDEAEGPGLPPAVKEELDATYATREDLAGAGLPDEVAAKLTIIERGSLTTSSTPRPDWPGIVEWYIYDGDPIPENIAEGDLVTVVTEWSPATIQGLLAWWDVRATETGDGDVLRVPDKSGNDYHMISSSPLAQGTVTYSETAFNDTPGLVFDGGGTLATEEFPGIGTGPVTIFANIERTSNNNPTAFFLGGHDSNTIGLYQVGANLDLLLGARRGDASQTAPGSLAPRSVVAVFDGSNSSFHVDGQVISWAAQNTDVTTLVMGGRYNATTGEMISLLTGTIGDIFILQGAASPDLIAAGEKWLRQRAELDGA